MVSADYTKAVARGRKLLSEIDKTPADTTPSPWTSFSSLSDENWEHQRFGSDRPFERGMIKDYPLSNSDTAPHENRDDTPTRNISWKHDANTGAFYTQWYHPSGAILPIALQGPGYARVREDQDVREREPKLQHWSDVTFLQWAELTGNSEAMRKGLKRTVHCNVTSIETMKVVMEVLGKYPEDWPFPEGRFTREGNEESFAALLGTPNGVGTGYLLVEHKEQLGWKKVESVHVYTQDTHWYLAIDIEEKEKEKEKEKE